MDDFDLFDGEDKRGKYQNPGDYHLQSPIRPDSLYYFGAILELDQLFLDKYDRLYVEEPFFIKSLVKSLKSQYPHLMHNLPNNRIIFDSIIIYGYYLSEVYNSKHKITNWIKKHMNQTYESLCYFR